MIENTNKQSEWLELLRTLGPLARRIVFGKNQRPLEQMEWVGVSLYAATLVLELLPAALRFLVFWGIFFLLGVFTPIDLPLELTATLLAGWPLAWSLLALRHPGRGDRWQRKAGARRPTLQEAEVIYGRMPNPPSDPRAILTMEIFVIEDNRAFGGSLGGAIILSTGLIDSEYLEEVLGHEMNHPLSLDARLSEALRRQRPWEDPLAEDENDRKAEHDPHPVRWLRWLLVGAGGGFGQWVLDLPLSWYWRQREFEADGRAVAMGYGPGLIAYFEAEKDQIDRPRPRLIAGGRYKHPPSRMRKERILALEDGYEITWKTELCLSSNFFARFVVAAFKLSDPYAEERFAH